MRFALIVLTAMFAVADCPSADAGKRAGVTMPDTTSVAGKTLRLNGMGLREATMLKVDVYVAGLYVETVSSDAAKLVAADETKLLVLRFKRDVDRDDIVKAWNDGFQGNATVSLDTLKADIDQLNQWMPSFDKGDTLSFLYVPGQGVTVQVNDTPKGVIAGEEFARSLFSIWLGPRPPTGDLKRGLLGSHPKA